MKLLLLAFLLIVSLVTHCEAKESSDFQIVVVASEDIAEGEVIRAEILQERKLPIKSRVPGDALHNRACAEGKKAKHGIACSQILVKTDLSPKPTEKKLSAMPAQLKVVCAKRIISKGTVIETSMLEELELPLELAPFGAFDKIQDISGFIAKRAISDKEGVTPDCLIPSEACLRDTKKMVRVFGASWHSQSSPVQTKELQ